MQLTINNNHMNTLSTDMKCMNDSISEIEEDNEMSPG